MEATQSLETHNSLLYVHFLLEEVGQLCASQIIQGDVHRICLKVNWNRHAD